MASGDLINYANFNISDKGLESCYYVDYIFKANENFSQLALIIADNEDLTEFASIVFGLAIGKQNGVIP